MKQRRKVEVACKRSVRPWSRMKSIKLIKKRVGKNRDLAATPVARSGQIIIESGQDGPKLYIKGE